MQNITKRCPETIGVDILGLADNLLLSGDNWKSIAPHVIDRYWRAMQDSNPRLRLRRPEGYPDYPNRP